MPLFALEPLAERLALERLHDEVQRAVLEHAEVADADDVRVIEPARRERLALEPLRRLLAAAEPACRTLIATARPMPVCSAL